MDGKKVALLAGALIMAGISAFTARSMFGAGQTAAQATPMLAAPVGPEVLVATRALPVGTIIGPDSFRYTAWPKDLVDEKAYYVKGQSDAASLQGSVVRNEVTAGSPITLGALVKPGDRGFLAAALGPGMRAVTLSVSNQGGVAGFVFPGDRVDLVLTQTVAGGGQGDPLKVAETIMRNVRVLATDQRTEKTVDENGKSVVATYGMVTVEATPKIAEKLAVAQNLGQLSLSLRSIADNTAELESAIASGAVSVPDGANPKDEKKLLLEVASRPIDGDSTFATGADVSRFSRRTVPASAPATPMIGAPAAGPAAPPSMIDRPAGPSVRIARGNSITIVPVGGK